MARSRTGGAMARCAVGAWIACVVCALTPAGIAIADSPARGADEPGAVSASISSSLPAYAGSVAQFRASVSGGFPPYHLHWSASGVPFVDGQSGGTLFSLRPTRAGLLLITLVAEDEAGYTATANYEIEVHAPIGTTLDVTPPTITISSPPEGATFPLALPVAAQFSCADEPGGSGIASCVGSSDDGAPLPTGTLGVQWLRVQATDNAGNTVERSVSYVVSTLPFPLPLGPSGPGTAPAPGTTVPPPAAPSPAPGLKGASLRVVLRHRTEPIGLGQTRTVAVKVVNAGPATARGVRVRLKVGDVLRAPRTRFGPFRLAADRSRTFLVPVTLLDRGHGRPTLRATVTAENADPRTPEPAESVLRRGKG